mmetsp:Transcript_154742/g.375768  ORF Transcript_154742/g.375768 Transcript_154742/m.375768 type:complete len:109 (+) Transcript_154742:124-450(+)
MRTRSIQGGSAGAGRGAAAEVELGKDAKGAKYAHLVPNGVQESIRRSYAGSLHALAGARRGAAGLAQGPEGGEDKVGAGAGGRPNCIWRQTAPLFVKVYNVVTRQNRQ